LTLTTDVYNGGEGFYKLANIESLVNLEKLELIENGLGIDKFKSEFKSSFLLKLSNLKSLILDGIKNVKDLADFKNLSKLEYLKIRNSNIENLNGVQSLTCLKNFELYDCHSITDLYSVSNNRIEKLSFNISSFWATEVKIKKEDLLKLDQVDIPNIEISIDDMKFPKKDYTGLSKKYDIDAEKGSLSLDLKK
jgi:Leucine-rich repeat (LRR) protein